MRKKNPRPPPVPAEPIPGLVAAHTHLASTGATTQAEVDTAVARAVAAGVDEGVARRVEAEALRSRLDSPQET